MRAVDALADLRREEGASERSSHVLPRHRGFAASVCEEGESKIKTITEITITNFQSHARTTIHPAPAGQLTALTGPTDSGKSAVFRALRWLFYNGPYYPRTGSAQTKVAVTFDDGTTVQRIRSSGVNRYVVGDQVYEGFGRDVPLEVQQALGIREVVIGDLAFQVNLARQHDPAFLITGVSAPARAKALGQIAGVDAVDLAIKDAGKDIFDAQREQAQVEKQIAELEEAEKQYEHLPELSERIEHLRKLAVEIEAAEERRNELAAIQDRLAAIRAQEQAALDKLRRIGDVERAAWALDDAAWAQERGAALEAIRARLSQAAEGMAAARSVLRRLGRVDEAATLLREADGAQGQLVNLRGVRDKLAYLDTEEARVAALLDQLAGSERAGALVQEAEAERTKVAALSAIQGRLAELDAEQKAAEARLRRAERALSTGPVLIEIGDALERLLELDRVQNALMATSAMIQGTENRIRKAEADLEQATIDYAYALLELGRCPTCGGVVADKTHVLEVIAG